MEKHQVLAYKRHVGEELVLGFLLTRENIEQIIEGSPIAVELGHLDIEGCKILIGFGTESEAKNLTSPQDKEVNIIAKGEERLSGRW